MNLESIITDIVRAPIDSPLILVLSVLYLLVQAIKWYDVRIYQKKRFGTSSAIAERAEGHKFPDWARALHTFGGWAILIALLLLNWKYTLVLFVFLWFLKFLPLLENLGELMMRPFLRQEED